LPIEAGPEQSEVLEDFGLPVEKQGQALNHDLIYRLK
jgi:hypothetical protein